MMDVEGTLEADDGVVEVARVVPHLTFPWAALPAGPRRWAPTDLSVEVDDGRLHLVRLTYRTVGDRCVVIAGAAPGVEVDWLAEQLATPLLFAHHRRAGGGLPPVAIMAALAGEPVWNGSGVGGWRHGRSGVGERPVRLAHLAEDDGHLLVAAHGVAEEEVITLVGTLIPLTADASDSDETADLHQRHRRALAQRWWDAPRVPWTPAERE
ncbi:hypothetical protein BH23ACT9_BH23ACT9_02150 [soil metagenome]